MALPKKIAKDSSAKFLQELEDKHSPFNQEGQLGLTLTYKKLAPQGGNFGTQVPRWGKEAGEMKKSYQGRNSLLSRRRFGQPRPQVEK